jgi:hypothetical protein
MKFVYKEERAVTQRLYDILDGIAYCQTWQSRETELTERVHAHLIQYALAEGQDDRGCNADVACASGSEPDFFQLLNVPFMLNLQYSVIEIKVKKHADFASDAQRLAAADLVELVHDLTKWGDKVTAKVKPSDWCVCCICVMWIGKPSCATS